MDRARRRGAGDISGARIALSGYYGFRNAGDEAVLAGIVRAFATVAPGREPALTALSGDPADTRRRHAIEAEPRFDRSAVAAVIQRSDLLISGGGSLLQDTTSLRSLLYYLWVMRLAAKSGRPYMVYAQGIGPLRRPVSRWLVRGALNGARAVTVRDADSADLLREIGVRPELIETTADPAFALDPPDHALGRALLARAGVPPNRPAVGLAMRRWRGRGPTVQNHARMAIALRKRCGMDVVLAPLHLPGDLELAEEVAREAGGDVLVLRDAVEPDQMRAAIASMAGLAAMRLHGLIFGAMAGVPLVGLAYDPKVASLMRELDQIERCLPLERVEPTAAADLLADAVAQGEPLSRRLRDRAEERRGRALANAARALELAQ